MDAEREVPIRVLGKALRLLDLLAERRQPMTLTALAEATGYPKSTVYALLSSMRAYSYVEQQPDGRYFLGIRLYECGRAVSGAWDVTALVRPYLERLAELTGATAVVTLLERGHIINLEQVAPPAGVQVLSEMGVRLPVHATAQGKLYLALQSDADAMALLRTEGMPAFTPHTLVTHEAMLEQLSRIRADGFAVEDGEYKIGLRAVCAPVYDRAGVPRFAVGVVGLFRRVRSEAFTDATAAVRDVAAQLSAAI